MRILKWTILLFFLASPAAARTFTNREGKVLEGEILAVDAETVTLRVNGQSFAVPIETLIRSDQDHLRSWVNQESANRIEFRAAKTEEPGSLVSKRDGDEKIVESKQNYVIRIVNRSKNQFGPLLVKYNLVTQWENTSKVTDKSGIGKKSAFGIEPGSVEILGLKAGEEAVLATKPVLVRSRTWKVGWAVFNSSGSSAGTQWDDYTEKFSVEGIWVRVFSGEEVIAEWKDSGAAREGVNWSDTVVVVNRDVVLAASATETHEDLEPIPPIPASLRKDRNISDLSLKVMTAASDYSSMKYRKEKTGAVRDQKKLFKSLLDQYTLAIRESR